MSFPSFSTGEVLTAADMNAVGLWLVKTQTVGTGVSSVTVSGAFSSTYDNYYVTYTGGTGSTLTPLRIQLGATATGYYNTLVYGTYANALINANVNDNNAARWTYVGSTSTTFQSLQMWLYGPNLAARTVMSAQYVDPANAGAANGYLADNTQYTAFTMTPLAVGATITGGTIRVYGYRN